MNKNFYFICSICFNYLIEQILTFIFITVNLNLKNIQDFIFIIKFILVMDYSNYKYNCNFLFFFQISLSFFH